jgi:fibrillarin-like rRNA methylase
MNVAMTVRYESCSEVDNVFIDISKVKDTSLIESFNEGFKSKRGSVSIDSHERFWESAFACEAKLPCYVEKELTVFLP